MKTEYEKLSRIQKIVLNYTRLHPGWTYATWGAHLLTMLPGNAPHRTIKVLDRGGWITQTHFASSHMVYLGPKAEDHFQEIGSGINAN